MILKQYYLSCLAHASYLVGDEESGTAAIVDPQRDIDEYLADAEAAGLTIRHVLLTHFHADFLAGHLELRERAGARIHLGAAGQAEYDFTPARDGATIELGPKVRIGVLETPGHTPESVCYTVFDLEKSADAPHAVLTGDTLFIGDVGRPDLMASVGVTADELASSMYDSLHEKLLKLPDETLVYPAHGAGSMCGKSLSRETVSTIGQQRQVNYACKPMSREEFVKMATSDLPEAPAYFSYDATLNRQERPTLEKSLEESLVALPLDDVVRRRNAGAQVLDTRHQDDFAAGHLKDSTNIPLDGSYATWAGSLLHRERPIVIVCDPGKEEESAIRLGRIGFDHVAGHLEGGFETAKAQPDLVATLRRMTVDQLSKEIGGDAPPRIIDVRNCGEWDAGRIEGSVNIPLPKLESRLADVPRDGRVVLHCQSGYRSSIATSILARHGYEDVHDLVGGFVAWNKAHATAAS